MCSISSQKLLIFSVQSAAGRRSCCVSCLFCCPVACLEVWPKLLLTFSPNYRDAVLSEHSRIINKKWNHFVSYLIKRTDVAWLTKAAFSYFWKSPMGQNQETRLYIRKIYKNKLRTILNKKKLHCKLKI